MSLTEPATASNASTPQGSLFRHVLHPTSLAGDNAVAFAHALKIALAGRSDFSIVHTGDGLEVGVEWNAFPQVRETLIQWDLLPQGAAPESVGELGLHIHKSDIGSAEPGKAIAHFAEQNDCDLMVLTAHPRHGLERWTRPSLAEPLARRTGLPTLFLPDEAAGFVDPATGAIRLKNILVPVDREPEPAAAVVLAQRLGRGLGQAPVLHLLHVGSERPAIEAELSLPSQWHAAEGPVVEAICQTAANVDADLIVMATHGHHGFLDALRGSTTEQVLRSAGRALLAVPAA